jgi:hypothetical protein
MKQTPLKGIDNIPDNDLFLSRLSPHARSLYDTFLTAYQGLGPVRVYPTKSMIGIADGNRRIAWVTGGGRAFLAIVFPFSKPYPDNECFMKIAQVPGQRQFNHHFRMERPEDLNDEVIRFMALALSGTGS